MKGDGENCGPLSWAYVEAVLDPSSEAAIFNNTRLRHIAQVHKSLVDFGIPQSSDNLLARTKRKQVDIPSIKKYPTKVAKTSRAKKATMNRPKRSTRLLARYHEIPPDPPMPLSQLEADDDYIPDTPIAGSFDSSEDDSRREGSETTVIPKTSTPSIQAPEPWLENLWEGRLTEEQRITIKLGRRSGLSIRAIANHLGGFPYNSLVKSWRYILPKLPECAFSTGKYLRTLNELQHYKKHYGVTTFEYPDPRLCTGTNLIPILREFHQRSTVDIQESVGGSVIISLDYLVEDSNYFTIDPIRCLVNTSSYRRCKRESRGKDFTYQLPRQVDRYYVPQNRDHRSIDIVAGNYVF